MPIEVIPTNSGGGGGSFATLSGTYDQNTSLNTKIVAMDAVDALKEALANKDTDGTLAANSDTKYPSQKAVKTYADTKQAFPLRETMVDADKTFSSGKTEVYLSVALTAARVLTLPLANAFPAGTEIVFVDEIGGTSPTNYVTITAAGSDLINGASTLQFINTNGTQKLITNGVSKWTGNVSPAFFTGSYVPSFTGFSVDPSSVTATYTVVGNLCTVIVNMAPGTSNSTGKTITLPFLSANYSTFWTAPAQVTNAGTTATTPGRIRVPQLSNIATVYRDYTNTSSTTFTTSGNCSFVFTITYQIY